MIAFRALANRDYRGLFTEEEYADVVRFFRSRSDLTPTPLRRLDALARHLGIGELLVKDESSRFGLNAFKIVGVTYALHHLLAHRLPVGSGFRLRVKLRRTAGALAEAVSRTSDGLTLICASSGNHGRAVAHAARKAGLRARVYLPAGTVQARIDAIANEGADVVATQGSYDDAVREARAAAASGHAVMLSDTALPGSTADEHRIPRLIMAGYTWLLEETPADPDVVLVQAGVGGLTAAVASWFAYRKTRRRPFIIACEPTNAACLMASAVAGRPVRLDLRQAHVDPERNRRVEGPLDTVMAGLQCGEVSAAAWPAIAAGIDAYLAVPDQRTFTAMRQYARPEGNDPAVDAGPSGACGLACLLALLEEPACHALREAARLRPESRVMIFNTEGTTDPELRRRLTSG